jgi:DNA-binding transcriptional LysR family regulator
MNLSSRDLRAFVALIEEGSFTRAAQRVHLSQPAFSALVQALEDSFGARLFDRTTRRVSLTAEGKLLEESARRLLDDLEAMVSDFRDHAQHRKGRVSIAALPSLAAGWLPGVLAEFNRRHPGVEIVLLDMLSEQCKSLVRARRADLALATAAPGEQDLASEFLCADEFHLVCREDHPLARRRNVGLADLAAYPFIHLSRSSSVRQYLDAAFHPMQMRTVAEVEHLATVTGLVAAGLGISVVPALTLFQFERKGLVLQPVKLPGLHREVVILRRKEESLSANAQALRQLMLEHKPRTKAGRRSAAKRSRD